MKEKNKNVKGRVGGYRTRERGREEMEFKKRGKKGREKEYIKTVKI